MDKKLPSLKKFDFLNQLRDLVYQEAKDKGWHTKEEGPPNVAQFMINLVGEISEFWEAWRVNKLNDLCDKADKMVANGIQPLTCAEEEIADIIIRTLDTAAALNVDVAKAVVGKILFNRTRDYRNGGKLA